MIIDPAAAIVNVNAGKGQIVSVYGGGGSDSGCCCCCASDVLFFSLYVGGAAVDDDDDGSADDGPGVDRGAEEEDGNADGESDEGEDDEATAKDGGRSSSDRSAVGNDVLEGPVCSFSEEPGESCKLAFQLDDDWNGSEPSGSGDRDEDASTGVIFLPDASNAETGRALAEGSIGRFCVWGSIFEIATVACSGGDEVDVGIGRDNAKAWAGFRAGGHKVVVAC